jgi:hypothetical protein
MKRNLIILTLALVCASFLCVTACFAKTEVIKKEKRETGKFQKISSGGGIDVYFTQDKSYSVVVEADEEYIDQIVTKVEDETLIIKWKNKHEKRFDRQIFSDKVLNVYVSAPKLEAVSASGGSDFHTDKLKCDDSFKLSVSGGSDANIKSLTVADNANLASSGGADIDITSLIATGNTNIATSGGADCDIDNLQTRDCNLAASGGADIDIKSATVEDLNIAASGGADISVAGKAVDVKISSSGGSDVDVRKLTYKTIDIDKSGNGDVDR